RRRAHLRGRQRQVFAAADEQCVVAARAQRFALGHRHSGRPAECADPGDQRHDLQHPQRVNLARPLALAAPRRNRRRTWLLPAAHCFSRPVRKVTSSNDFDLHDPTFVWPRCARVWAASETSRVTNAVAPIVAPSATLTPRSIVARVAIHTESPMKIGALSNSNVGLNLACPPLHSKTASEMQVFDPMTTGSALMIQVDSPIQVSLPISNFQGQSILTSCFMSVPVPIRAPNRRSTN